MIAAAFITFTAPAFLAGASLALLPILAHLLPRRRRGLVRFAGTSLLREAIAQQRSRHRLRDRLLMMMRCLILLLISLAFTGPTFAPLPSSDADRAEAVVLVFDRSASTAQRRDGTVVFSELQRDAQKLLATLTPGVDHAAIIYADRLPHPATRLTRDFERLRTDLRSQQPRAINDEPGPALRRALELLDDRAGPARLIVFTDAQQHTWKPALARLDDAPPQTPVDLAIDVVTPPAKPGANVAVHHPRTTNDPTQTTDATAVSVDLTLYGDRPRVVEVAAAVEDQVVASRAVQLAPNVPATTTFAVPLAGSHWRHVHFSLRGGDALAVDDRAGIALRPMPRKSVILLANRTRAAELVTMALQPFGEGRDRLRLRRIPPGRLTQADLRSADVMVLLSAPRDSAATAVTLAREAGLGLVTFPAASDADPLATLQTPIDDTSPLDHALGESAALIRVPRSDTDSRAAGRVVLRFADGAPAARLDHRAGSRLLHGGFAIDPGRGNLHRSAAFVALLHEMIEVVAPRRASALAFRSDQPVEFHVDAIPRDAPPPVVRLSPEPALPATFAQLPHAMSIATPPTGRVGEGVVRAREQTLAKFVINPPPGESNLRAMDSDRLARELRDVLGVQGRSANAPSSRTETTPRPLTPLLLIAALGIVAMESHLAGRWRS